MKNPLKNLFNRKQRRVLLKGLLTDVDVELISLLFDEMKPANRKGAVVKGADGTFKPLGGCAKFKSDKEGRLYVTVMEPNVKDGEGDFYTEAEIVKAMSHFSKKGLVRKNDVNHNFQVADGVYIEQTYILKTADKDHFPDAAIGSWVAVVKFEDLTSELWKKAEAGKFNGVSIYGHADDHVDNTETLKALEDIRKSLNELAKSESPDAAKIKDMETKLKDLDSRLRGNDGTDGDGDDAVLKELREVVKSFSEIAVTLRKGINKALGGEPGGDMDKDRTIDLANGEKLVIKAARKELYKSLSSLYTGDKMNILTPDTLKLFLDAIITRDGDLLSDFSILPITKTGTVDTGLLAALIFTNSADSRVIQAVGTGSLAMGPQILHSITSLSAETCEFYKDALGSDEAFGAYIESALTLKIREALEDLVFAGNRTGLGADSGSNLGSIDGIIAKATAAAAINTVSVDSVTIPDYITLFTAILTAFAATPSILKNIKGFKFYLSPTLYLNLYAQISRRETPLGDGFIINNAKLFYGGREVKQATMTDDTYICAGLSKAVVIGYINDVKIKVEHTGLDWLTKWFTRSNWGINYLSTMFKVFKMSAA